MGWKEGITPQRPPSPALRTLTAMPRVYLPAPKYPAYVGELPVFQGFRASLNREQEHLPSMNPMPLTLNLDGGAFGGNFFIDG